MHLRNLKFHIRTHRNSNNTSAPNITHPNTSTTTNANQCALCSDFCADRKTVIEHYRDFHNIPIEHKKLTFQSEEEFITWKLSFENDTNCKYVVNYQKCFKSHVAASFNCHRSGRYVPEGKNIRHLKILGSRKINALCPASIKIKKLNNGTCEVTIMDKHVGHQNDIGHLNLSKTERENLAVKISSKVPFEDILDEIRDSITDSELKRLHLLTKKDLYNIEACFNLCSSSVRHKNDIISVESWINDMQSNGDAVLFYKPQGSESEEWPMLKNEDFVLIIMTAAQCEMLKIYGTDCICIDGTHGMNNYDFELITLLVVDDFRQGFPCSFLVSNRSDKQVLKIFFHFAKSRLGTALCPNVFMSDMAEAFFNAWIKIMSPPKFRLYCSWHVDQAWRKNLSKINTKEKH
ncbi:uncharacterized protein LOC126746956 isoform X1 [Anthonomus grandis grandis]|uniref:uncharacterized protein LOC126746956 isoform X1 n=1 Tax=Anthonomus grandis grandis TaxID=2921223 RepID=UPI002165EF59|nr:uncharacterized protein LOC126746956 isoform X1 [Anthonomus grandis grandis]